MRFWIVTKFVRNPPSHRWLTKCIPARLASSEIDSCACFFVPTKRICPPSAARSRMNVYASSTRVSVCWRSMMWMPFRSMKMKRFIFGFQRRAWCPKWTPDSRSCFMVTTATWVSLVPPPANPGSLPEGGQQACEVPSSCSIFANCSVAGPHFLAGTQDSARTVRGNKGRMAKYDESPVPRGTSRRWEVLMSDGETAPEAGHERRTARDVRAEHRVLLSFSDSDLGAMPLVPENTRLARAGWYLDLHDPGRADFRATGDETVEPGLHVR